MRPRFFVPDLGAPPPSTLLLPPEEAHHLLKVLRLGPGDEVAVFDGRGAEFTAIVSGVTRGRVTVTPGHRLETAPAPAVALTLVQSVLKGEAMDSVVRDATMAGVRAIQPVISARTAVKSSLIPRAAGRWPRVAIAAAKQCGRAHLPALRPPTSFDGWLGSAEPDNAFILVEPSLATGSVLRLRDLAARPAPASASLLVGPEGGWTPGELAAARRAGCSPLTLGPLTLRADAVPIVAATALLALWDES